MPGRIFSQCNLPAGFLPGRAPVFSQHILNPPFFIKSRHFLLLGHEDTSVIIFVLDTRRHIYVYTHPPLFFLVFWFFFSFFWSQLLIEFAVTPWQHKTWNYSPIIHFTEIVCERCLHGQFPTTTAVATLAAGGCSSSFCFITQPARTGGSMGLHLLVLRVQKYPISASWYVEGRRPPWLCEAPIFI